MSEPMMGDTPEKANERAKEALRRRALGPPIEPESVQVAPERWYSLAVQVAMGERIDGAEGDNPEGIGIAAIQVGDEVCLMLALEDGHGLTLASPIRLEEWNRFTASIQLALMDAANLELERRRLAGHPEPGQAKPPLGPECYGTGCDEFPVSR